MIFLDLISDSEWSEELVFFTEMYAFFYLLSLQITFLPENCIRWKIDEYFDSDFFFSIFDLIGEFR